MSTPFEVVQVLLTWSCLNSSQLLRTDESLSSDQRTEKANVCARKGAISPQTLSPTLLPLGAGEEDGSCRVVLPGVAPSAPGLPHALIPGIVDLPLCLLLGAQRGSEQPEEVKWNFPCTALNPSPYRAFTPGSFSVSWLFFKHKI